MMTCVDNLALGYFKKQGFDRQLAIEPAIYKSFIEDYEGSTLMKFLVDPNINYRTIHLVDSK